MVGFAAVVMFSPNRSTNGSGDLAVMGDSTATT